MNEFLNEVNKYQTYMEEQMRIQQENEDIAISGTYSVLNSLGFTQSYSVRLPVHIIAQLDELKKYTPHDTKGEMIFRMLESLITDFCENSERTQKVFEKVGQEAFDKRKQELEEKESKSDK